MPEPVVIESLQACQVDEALKRKFFPDLADRLQLYKVDDTQDKRGVYLAVVSGPLLKNDSAQKFKLGMSNLPECRMYYAMGSVIDKLASHQAIMWRRDTGFVMDANEPVKATIKQLELRIEEVRPVVVVTQEQVFAQRKSLMLASNPNHLLHNAAAGWSDPTAAGRPRAATVAPSFNVPTSRPRSMTTRNSGGH